MVTDSIADLLTRIRNATSANHPFALVPASKSKERILSVLLDEGYIESFESCEDDNKKPALRVGIRYERSGRPVVRELKRLSRPGRRLYVGKDDIPRHKGGLGTVVVSTSQGVMSDREARKRGVGGELLCSVF